MSRCRCHAWIARLPLLLAAVALLGLPVDLRAGTPVAHPHALVALLIDAADGSLDHDHSAPNAGMLVTGGEAAQDHADHHADLHALTDHDRHAGVPAESGAVGHADQRPDLPSLSEAGPGVGGGVALLVAGLSMSAVIVPSRRLPVPVAGPLEGHDPAPVVPPPRSA